MMKHPLQTILEDAEYEPQAYSGRGMFGQKCLGVVVRKSSGGIGTMFANVIKGLHDDIPSSMDVEQFTSRELDNLDTKFDDVASAFENMITDNMGLDIIVYFPDISYFD